MHYTINYTTMCKSESMSSEKVYVELGPGLAIYKLKQSKNWYIYLWDKQSKEAIRRSLKISDRTKAEHEARFLQMARERDLEGAILSKPSRQLKTIIKKLIDQLEKDKNAIKINYEKNNKRLSADNKYKEIGRTISIYLSIQKKLGDINVKELDYVHLKSYYAEYDKKVSKTQIRYMNMAVNKVLDYCLTNRLIQNVPQLPKIRSKTSKTNKYFNQHDYETIIKNLKSRKFKNKIAEENNNLLLQAFIFVTETGIRPGNELTNIQCSDLSVESIQGCKYWILQIKGGKIAEKDGVSRKIVISEKAMYCLKMIMVYYNSSFLASTNETFFLQHIKQNKNKYLFARGDGHVPDFTTLFGNLRDSIIDDLYEKNLVFYSCRHTFITNQLKRDSNINVVAKHCGTSTDMINKHYNHLLSMMKPKELLEDLYSVDDEIIRGVISQDMLKSTGTKNEKEYLENLNKWINEYEEGS